VKLPAALLLAGLWLAGCAFVPKAYPRLDATGRAYIETQADSRIAIDAAPELAKAGDLLERAHTARNTLDDSAVVDHLAYMAKQRIAIAREVASQKASQRIIAAATLRRSL
jgi:hypothetical protein